jgi:hypothetical protein
VCVGSCGEHSEKIATSSFQSITFRRLLNALVSQFGISDWMVYPTAGSEMQLPTVESSVEHGKRENAADFIFRVQPTAGVRP